MDNTSRKYMLMIAACVGCIMILHHCGKKSKVNRKNRRTWARKWLQKRDEGRGLSSMLNNELLNDDPQAYRNFLRMSNTQFEYILQQIEKSISKQDTNMRQCVTARTKLEITLRYLASGDSYRSLMYSMRVHESTISKFLPIVCKSIIEKLRPIYLKTPNTKEQWKATADKFNELWNFPNCLGALDGRHITFRAPISDGSFYYNYKGSNSIVLLALVNANYMFTYVNIGVNGRISDGGVFSRSNLCNGMKSNLLNFPETVELPGTTEKVPYVIVADDAFPLLTNLMKPYPERDLTHDCRIFNYRLSRARRIVENAFGILANRFRVLLNPINLNVEKVELITLTCIIIHNFLATENVRYTDINEPLEQLARLSRQGGNRSSPAARNVRDTYKQYFNSPQGIVDWQENSIRMFNH